MITFEKTQRPDKTIIPEYGFTHWSFASTFV